MSRISICTLLVVFFLPSLCFGTETFEEIMKKIKSIRCQTNSTTYDSKKYTEVNLSPAKPGDWTETNVEVKFKNTNPDDSNDVRYSTKQTFTAKVDKFRMGEIGKKDDMGEISEFENWTLKVDFPGKQGFFSFRTTLGLYGFGGSRGTLAWTALPSYTDTLTCSFCEDKKANPNID